MSERETIEFEAARNKAVDAFFNARPAITRDKNSEFLVESGFRLAWERQQAEIERLKTQYLNATRMYSEECKRATWLDLITCKKR